MSENAIHLIRFHSAIFQHENPAARIEFPRSAESGFDESHASAEQNTARRAFAKRGATEIERPSTTRLCKSGAK